MLIPHTVSEAGSSQGGRETREQQESGRGAREQPGEQPSSSQGNTGSSQGAGREAKEQPRQPGNNQGNHGVTAPCTGQVQDNYRTTTGQPTGQLQDNLLLL